MEQSNHEYTIPGQDVLPIRVPAFHLVMDVNNLGKILLMTWVSSLQLGL